MTRNLQQLKRDLAKVTGRNTRFGEEAPPKPKNKWRRRLRNAALLGAGAVGAGLLYKHGPDLKLTHNAKRIAGDVGKGVKRLTGPSAQTIRNREQAGAANIQLHDWLMKNPGKTEADFHTYIARKQPDLTPEQLKEKFDIYNWIKVDGAMYLIIDYSISKLPSNSSFIVKDVKDKKLKFQVPYNDARITIPTQIEKTAAEQMYKKNVANVLKNNWISVADVPYFVKDVSIAYPPQPSTFTVNDITNGKDIVWGLPYNDPAIKYLSEEEVKQVKKQLPSGGTVIGTPVQEGGGKVVDGYTFDFGKRNRKTRFGNRKTRIGNRKTRFGLNKYAENRIGKDVKYNGEDYRVVGISPGKYDNSTTFNLLNPNKPPSNRLIEVTIYNDEIITLLPVQTPDKNDTNQSSNEYLDNISSYF